ncbi:unnamed protein product [Heterosigma akashiwo]
MWGVTGKIAEAAGSSGAVPVMTPGARLVSAGCALHALAYIAYGIRMLFFIQIRNTSESYVNSDRFKRFADSEKKIALGRRLSVWWSTALLLGGLYALPLNLHLGQALECIQVVVPEVAKKKAKDAVVNNGGQVVLKEGFQLWRSIGAGAASLMALVALGVQAIADDQKLKHKEALYAEEKKAGAPPAAPWRERQLQYEAAAAAPAPVSGFCAPRAGCTPATPYYGEGYVGEPGAAPFCTSGLYSKWRHPNYCGGVCFPDYGGPGGLASHDLVARSSAGRRRPHRFCQHHPRRDHAAGEAAAGRVRGHPALRGVGARHPALPSLLAAAGGALLLDGGNPLPLLPWGVAKGGKLSLPTTSNY